MSAENDLVTFVQFQIHSEWIKDFLDSYDGWNLEGGVATPNYSYRNSKPLILLEGINSVENFVSSGQSLTIPSSAYDSETQITISGSGNEITFGGAANFLIKNQNNKVNCSSGNDTIEIAGNNCTINNFSVNDLLCVADSDSTVTSATIDGGAQLTIQGGGSAVELFLADKTTGDTISLQLGNNAVQSYTLT